VRLNFTKLSMSKQSRKAFWFLVGQLVRAELVTDYKKSFLGLTWMFLLPLLSVLLWIGLHAAGIVDPGDTQIPYPVYVLLSTTLWNFFHEMYRSVSHVLDTNARILLLKDFPISILLFKQVLVHLIRFSILLTINLLVMLGFGVSFTAWIFIFPFALIPLLMLASGLGLVMAVFRIILVDVSTAFDEFMKLLMFLTPVIYSPGVEWPLLKNIIHWNPLSYLIGMARGLLTIRSSESTISYIGSTIFALTIFIVGIWFFKKAYKRVLERLTT